MADDVLDFLPLFPDETEEAILARMRGWANEGLDPVADAESWVDTREGSHFHVSVMPGVREFARIYDLMGTEVVAAAFPVWAWADYLDDHAEVYSIARLAAVQATGSVTFSGPATTEIAAGTVVGTVPSSPDAEGIEFVVTTGGVIGGGGTLVLPVRAVDAGAAGIVGAGAIVELVTPIAGVSVTNAAATAGGTDPESDESLRDRIITAFIGEGAGSRNDYVRWSRAVAGVGRVTVIPLWNGPGTVKVILLTETGDPVAASVVTAVQQLLDPTAGLGDGRAPIGANVTVQTAVALNIDITALIEFEAGYSVDGAGSTVARRAAITEALREYVERVQPGEEIVYQRVRGIIATVEGVHDVGAVTIEGGTVNVAVDDDPAQAPQLVEPLTLTAGSV